MTRSTIGYGLVQAARCRWIPHRSSLPDQMSRDLGKGQSLLRVNGSDEFRRLSPSILVSTLGHGQVVEEKSGTANRCEPGQGGGSHGSHVPGRVSRIPGGP
jgi:hypothetical protein